MIRRIFIILAVSLILGACFFILRSNKTKERFNSDTQEFRGLSLSRQVDYLDKASKTMSVLELRNFIKAAYPDEPPGEHALAHKFGELVIRKEGIDGFGFCDTLLQFGCFHGAALAAVRVKGDDPNLASELWEACKKNTKYPGSCLHGLGHAIMVIKQYDLLAAYGECKRILNGQEAFWCEDGVSMENISRSMATSELEPYGKAGNIYYPCDSVPKEFEAPCARNHVGYLQRQRGMDFKQTLSYCKSFSLQKTVEECINVVGSLTEKEFFDNTESIVDQCRSAGKYNQFCIEGAVIAYSMSRQFDRAKTLCNTFHEESTKRECHMKIESFFSLN